jgi:adenine phosphoribosyltransferase
LGGLKMKPYLRRIDTHASGRYDVTPLFADADALGELVSDLVAANRTAEPNVVACIDALGFILGASVARAIGVGVVAIRKGGKLPVSAEREAFVDYSGTQKVLELRSDALGPDHRVLLVDDWIEAGAQIGAAIRLVERCRACVVSISAIHMDLNETTQSLAQRYRVHTATELGKDPFLSTDSTEEPPNNWLQLAATDEARHR